MPFRNMKVRRWVAEIKRLEAAGHEKMHVSYVRAVLLDWLGIARGPP